MFYAVYVTIVLLGICLIGAILRFLVKKRLNESNAILWMCIGFIIILAGLFPRVVVKLSDFFMITYPPAFIFTVAIIILLLIVLKNTIINSELSAKLQETAMEVSILRKELVENKKVIEQMQLKIYQERNMGSEAIDSLEAAQTYTVSKGQYERCRG
ncbi:MAG: DUF2304 domain-containing protein [Eubacteriaceae bacterium]